MARDEKTTLYTVSDDKRDRVGRSESIRDELGSNLIQDKDANIMVLTFKNCFAYRFHR